ncbi:MAG: hypothetical protein L3J73_03805 [Thermoplasmata archaeon]|nr:hypothetical protein [Thermoplasmata archaeon]
MSDSRAAESPSIPKRRRRLLLVAAVAALVVAASFALLFVPANTSSNQIVVAPGASATTQLTIPHPGRVTVHFDDPHGMGPAMHYWMQGSSGMMFNHAMMNGGDGYSFWSWGGTYDCGAAYEGSGSGMMTIWVNATWGML